jgi:hypothetical protein
MDVGLPAAGAIPTGQVSVPEQSTRGAGGSERAAPSEVAQASSEGLPGDVQMTGAADSTATGGRVSDAAREIYAASAADPAGGGAGARATRATTDAQVPQAAAGEQTTLDTMGGGPLRASDATDRAGTSIAPGSVFGIARGHVARERTFAAAMLFLQASPQLAPGSGKSSSDLETAGVQAAAATSDRTSIRVQIMPPLDQILSAIGASIPSTGGPSAAALGVGLAMLGGLGFWLRRAGQRRF